MDKIYQVQIDKEIILETGVLSRAQVCSSGYLGIAKVFEVIEIKE